MLIKKGVIFKGGKERDIKLLFNPFEEKFEIEIPPLRNKPEWFNVTEVIQKGAFSVVNRDELKKIGWDENKIDMALERLSSVRDIFMGWEQEIMFQFLPSLLIWITKKSRIFLLKSILKEQGLE